MSALWLIALAATTAASDVKTVETSTTVVHAWIDDTVAGRDELPALEEVQAAAVRALGLGTAARAEDWDASARWRAVLPQLQVRFGSQRDLLVRDSLAGTDWARTGQGLGLDISARWGLGDLLLSDLEMRVHRERLARSAAERLARERATQVYFQRVEVLVQMRQAPAHELVLEAARLDGLLRALTAGRYRRKNR